MLQSICQTFRSVMVKQNLVHSQIENPAYLPHPRVHAGTHAFTHALSAIPPILPSEKMSERNVEERMAMTLTKMMSKKAPPPTNNSHNT